MANVDRHFCKVTYAALCELLDDNRSKLGREFVRDMKEEFDPKGDRESEDAMYEFAGRVMDIFESKRIERDYDDRDLADATLKILQRMIDKASDRGRRNRDRDRGRDRDRDRRRDYDDRDRGRNSSWGSSSSSSRTSRNSRDASICDERQAPDRSRGETTSSKTESREEVDTVSQNVNPLEKLDTIRPQDFIKVHVDEEWQNIMASRGVAISGDAHEVKFTDGPDVRVYSAQTKDILNTSFEHLKRFFDVFPSAITELHPSAYICDLRTIVLTTLQYRHLNISLKEFIAIRTALSELPEADRYNPVRFGKLMDEFPRRVWKVVSAEMTKRFNSLSVEYLRSEKHIRTVVTITDLDWLIELDSESVQLAIKQDPYWDKTFRRLFKKIVTTMFFSPICNHTSLDEMRDKGETWANYLACDAITFPANTKFVNKFDVIQADEPVARRVLDSVNHRCVFWIEQVTILVTNMLSEKTINRIPVGVDGVDSTDFEAFRGILAGMSFLRGDNNHVEVYTTLFKESPSTFLKHFDIVIPMTPESKFVTLSATKTKVIGM